MSPADWILEVLEYTEGNICPTWRPVTISGPPEYILEQVNVCMGQPYVAGIRISAPIPDVSEKIQEQWKKKQEDWGRQVPAAPPAPAPVVEQFDVSVGCDPYEAMMTAGMLD